MAVLWMNKLHQTLAGFCSFATLVGVCLKRPSQKVAFLLVSLQTKAKGAPSTTTRAPTHTNTPDGTIPFLSISEEDD